MDRRHPAVVHGVRVRPRRDEQGDDFTLRCGIPVLGPWASVGRVVKRLGTHAVAGAHVGPCCHEQCESTALMRCRGDVQRSVTRVDVMTNRTEEVPVSIATARPDVKRTVHEDGRRLDQS